MGFVYYFEVFDFQCEIVKIYVVFGGKNLHLNWIVGGMFCVINIDESGVVGAVNMECLNLVQLIIICMVDFINNVMIFDVLVIGQFNKLWSEIGIGFFDKCVFSYGVFLDIVNDFGEKSLLMFGGVVINGDFNNVLLVDLVDLQQVQEFVDYVWY